MGVGVWCLLDCLDEDSGVWGWYLLEIVVLYSNLFDGFCPRVYL